MGDVALQVAVRCRPFSDRKSKLGVICENCGDQQVVLTRPFNARSAVAFNHCWWTGYGHIEHLDDDDEHANLCKELPLIDQQAIYDKVGTSMVEHLLDGQAVVMFAYGLSGAGKTYTVFGPDDHRRPDAWFKSSVPQPQWGLFPRIAYQMLNLASKQNGWVVRVKYFQNVVHDVIDLFSEKNPPEKHSYKDMHKDKHGFTDISWIKAKVITTWSSLLKLLQEANTKKHIAPTQFNPSSTRGHCILFYEVDMPKKMRNGSTLIKTARMYVCDLAGAEPAAAVHYARYTTETGADGNIYYRYQGPHDDRKKTAELVEQGTKINQSLSEMSHFFLQMSKMLRHHEKNGTKPDPHLHRIAGCNSFFLGKFLTNTMLRAHTYLFAAIRPEEKYLRFTESTIDFARDASVIKLSPIKMNLHIQKRGSPRHGHRRMSSWATEDSEENEMVVSLREELARLRDKVAGRTVLTSETKRTAIHAIKDSVVLSDDQKQAALVAIENAETEAEIDVIRQAAIVHHVSAEKIEEAAKRAIHARQNSVRVDEGARKSLLIMIDDEGELSPEQHSAAVAAVIASPHAHQLEAVKEAIIQKQSPEKIRHAALEDEHVERSMEEKIWLNSSTLENVSAKRRLESQEHAEKVKKLDISYRIKAAAKSEQTNILKERLQRSEEQLKGLTKEMEGQSQEFEAFTSTLNDEIHRLKLALHNMEEEKSNIAKELQTEIEKRQTVETRASNEARENSKIIDQLRQGERALTKMLVETKEAAKLKQQEIIEKCEGDTEQIKITLNDSISQLRKLCHKEKREAKKEHEERLQVLRQEMLTYQRAKDDLQSQLRHQEKINEDLQSSLQEISSREERVLQNQKISHENKVKQMKKDHVDEVERIKRDMKELADRRVESLNHQVKFHKQSIEEMRKLHEAEADRYKIEHQQHSQAAIMGAYKELQKERIRTKEINENNAKKMKDQEMASISMLSAQKEQFEEMFEQERIRHNAMVQSMESVQRKFAERLRQEHADELQRNADQFENILSEEREKHSRSNQKMVEEHKVIKERFEHEISILQSTHTEAIESLTGHFERSRTKIQSEYEKATSQLREELKSESHEFQLLLEQTKLSHEAEIIRVKDDCSKEIEREKLAENEARQLLTKEISELKGKHNEEMMKFFQSLKDVDLEKQEFSKQIRQLKQSHRAQLELQEIVTRNLENKLSKYHQKSALELKKEQEKSEAILFALRSENELCLKKREEKYNREKNELRKHFENSLDSTREGYEVENSQAQREHEERLQVLRQEMLTYQRAKDDLQSQLRHQEKINEDLQSSLQEISSREERVLQNQKISHENKVKQMKKDHVDEVERIKRDMKELADRRVESLNHQVKFHKQSIEEMRKLHEAEADQYKTQCTNESAREIQLLKDELKREKNRTRQLFEQQKEKEMSLENLKKTWESENKNLQNRRLDRQKSEYEEELNKIIKVHEEDRKDWLVDLRRVEEKERIAREMYEELRQRLNEMNEVERRRVDEADVKNQDLQSKLTAKNLEIARLMNVAEDEKNKNSRLQLQIQRIQNDLTLSQSKMEDLQEKGIDYRAVSSEKIKKLNKECDVLNEQLASKTFTEIETLKTQYKNVELTLFATRTQVQEKTDELFACETKLDDTQKALNSYKLSLEDTEKRLEEQSARLKQLQHEHNSLRVLNNETQEGYDKLQARHDKTLLSVEKLTTDLVTVKEERRKLEENLASNDSNSVIEINRIQRELESVTTKLLKATEKEERNYQTLRSEKLTYEAENKHLKEMMELVEREKRNSRSHALQFEEKLSSENKRLKETMELLSVKNKEADLALRKLSEMNEKLQQTVEQLKLEKNNLISAKCMLEVKMEQSEEEKSQLEFRFSLKSQQMNENNTKLSEENHDLLRKINLLSSELKTKDYSLQAESRKSEEKDYESVKDNDKIKFLNASLRLLEEEKISLKDSLEQLEREHHQMLVIDEEKRKADTTRCEQLEEQLKHVEKELDDCKLKSNQRKSVLHEEVQLYKAEVAKCRLVNKDKDDQLKYFQRELESSRAQIRTLEERVETESYTSAENHKKLVVLRKEHARVVSTADERLEKWSNVRKVSKPSLTIDDLNLEPRSQRRRSPGMSKKVQLDGAIERANELASMAAKRLSHLQNGLDDVRLQLSSPWTTTNRRGARLTKQKLTLLEDSNSNEAPLPLSRFCDNHEWTFGTFTDSKRHY